MKKSIAILLLSLAALPVFADGMYETVSASQIIDTHSISVPAEFNYSPLYRQVTGDFKRAVDRQKVRVNTDTRITYTPLYLKVTNSTL